MDTPFFTIIVPAYNEEKLLPICLKALFTQDFPNSEFEVIVVDNNSTDRTKEIAKEYNVKLIEEKKQGLVFARNAGLKEAKGEYFINLDADCEVPKDWLRRIKNQIQKNKNIGLLTGPYKCVENKNEQDWWNFVLAILMSISCKILGTPFGYYGGNVTIERNSFLKIGGYELQYSTDQISIISRLKKIGKKIYFDRNLEAFCSPRRTKGRWLSFIFIDVIYLYLFNNIYTKFTGKNLGDWKAIR
jgi:glycosyltransferase involved in cell wall biosynthesis